MDQKKTDFQLLREELLEKLFSNGKYNKVKWKSHLDFRARINATPLSGYSTLAEKLIALRENLETRPGCEICGKPTKLKSSHFTRTCGNKCAALLPDRVEKSKVTNLTRRGTEFPSQSPAVRKKIEQTVMDKYGVRVSSQSDEVKKTAVENNMAKYGVKSTFMRPWVRVIALSAAQTSEAKEKRVSAIKSTWGTNRLNLTLRSKATQLKTAGTTFTFEITSDLTGEQQNEILEKYHTQITIPRLQKIEEESELIPLFDRCERNTYDEYKWKHKTCGNEFISYFSDNIIPTCPNCRPKSKPQQKVSDFCKSIGLEVKDNDRTAIKPYEIDILLVDKKIGIEVNGIYWHQHDSNFSLLDKTNLAEKQGLQLLHFWDYEINYQFEIVSSIIAAKCGIFSKRYFARKCELEIVSKEEAEHFFKQNHLSGFVYGSHYGLRIENQLVCCASFGKPRFGKDEALELLRFASLLNTQVIGGLSKLIQHVSQKHQKSIISFADRRLSTGAGYEKSGFKLVKITAPNYFYVKSNKTGFEILKRYGAMKHKLPTVLGDMFDSQLTEGQNMENAGWLKCSDSGNLKFAYDGVNKK